MDASKKVPAKSAATKKSSPRKISKRNSVQIDESIDDTEVDQFIKHVSGELLDVIVEVPTEDMLMKSVLLSIAWHTTNDWYCYAEPALIAKYAFCSLEDSDAAISSLIKIGILNAEGSVRKRRYSIDKRKVKSIYTQDKKAKVAIFATDDPTISPRLPGYYPIMNIIVWSAKLQTTQKLLIRYLIDSARDGWANVLFSELCYVTDLTPEKAVATLQQLVDLDIIAPPARKTNLSGSPREYAWDRKPVTRCLIKPSGLLRLIPIDR